MSERLGDRRSSWRFRLRASMARTQNDFGVPRPKQHVDHPNAPPDQSQAQFRAPSSSSSSSSISMMLLSLLLFSSSSLSSGSNIATA
eukprot:3639091-Rhodomonas_salina.2